MHEQKQLARCGRKGKPCGPCRARLKKSSGRNGFAYPSRIGCHPSAAGSPARLLPTFTPGAILISTCAAWWSCKASEVALSNTARARDSAAILSLRNSALTLKAIEQWTRRRCHEFHFSDAPAGCSSGQSCSTRLDAPSPFFFSAIPSFRPRQPIPSDLHKASAVAHSKTVRDGTSFGLPRQRCTVFFLTAGTAACPSRRKIDPPQSEQQKA
jgi:hypothetical protein